MEFPKLDGTNPRLWHDQCEIYFEIYVVISMLKTHFASPNFTGLVAVWLQTVERRQRFQDWGTMADAVLEHYDKDQYPL